MRVKLLPQAEQGLMVIDKEGVQSRSEAQLTKKIQRVSWRSFDDARDRVDQESSGHNHRVGKSNHEMKVLK